jgi:hypothetical protein
MQWQVSQKLQPVLPAMELTAIQLLPRFLGLRVLEKST